MVHRHALTVHVRVRRISPRELGLEGVRRGKRRRTTVADLGVPRPADLVERRFSQARPDAVRVADFTYVATWSGTVYVAFVLDAHSRRILGWRAATSMRTELVLDALEQDSDFLLEGGVFTPDVVETWIDYKRTYEVDAVRLRPHPYEFSLYYDI